jgi:hypothetical protein
MLFDSSISHELTVTQNTRAAALSESSLASGVGSLQQKANI